MLAALGGAPNLTGVEAAANRLLVSLADPARLDAEALRGLGVRAIARSGPGRLQLILAGAAADLSAELAGLRTS
jgi:phosphotransferase system IIB component